MGINKFIESVCVQDAVYWGNPQPDGYGGYTFDAPVEIKVRWDEKYELIRDKDGKETVSTAQVLLTQDVDYGGYLYLGTLNELSSDPANPLEVGGWEIKQFSRVYMIKSTTEQVRKAYL